MTMPDVELASLPLEVRSVDEPQRLAHLVVMRYGETSRRTGRPERFAAGAFTSSVTKKGDRIRFTTRHAGPDEQLIRGTAVARPVSWDTSSPLELRAVVRFFDNHEGWDAFGRAKAGELDGGSVGFRAIEEHTAPDGVRELTQAELDHVALFSRMDATPAYDGTRVLEARNDELEQLLAEAERLRKVTYDELTGAAWVSADEIRRMIHNGG